MFHSFLNFRCLGGDLNLQYSKCIYATLICYFFTRGLKIIGVNKFFGPYVFMIGKMFENMMYFVVLLLVVLIAFGICR